MDAPKNEDTAALGRQRLDDCLDLTQRFAGVELGFDIVLAAQQFEVCNRFEAHHLVAAGGVDDEVAGDGEKIGPAGGDIFPVFGGVGAGQNLCDHILQLMIGGQDASETPAQSGFLWQDNRLEPFQFRSNPMHVDPLALSAVPLPVFFYLSQSIIVAGGCPARPQSFFND